MFKNKKILITVLIVACLLFIFYSLSGVFVTLVHSAVDKVSEKTGWNVGKTLYDFESAINIFRPKKDLWIGDLPIFQFKLSENDIKHFDELAKKSVEQGYLDKEGNTWRSIKIKYKDKTYDAEIKLHGDLQNHWGSAYKSYNVKINNETINNLKKFRLVIFEDRFLRRRICNILAKEFDLFNVRDDFVVVKINGVPQGLYYLVENLDYTFLEMNQCSSCELIVMNDNKFRDHPRIEESEHQPYGLDYFQSRHMSLFNYELSHVDLEKSNLDKNKVLNSVNELFQAVKDGDTQKVISYFDMDYLTSFEAERMIHGSGSQVVGDNFKMVYRATNGKFYPLGFEGGVVLLKVEKGGVERSLSLYDFLNGQEEVKLFALLSKDDKIRQAKYKKAYQYIANHGDSFLKKIDDLVNYYLPYANSHKGSMLGTKTIENEIKRYKPLFENNIKIIKEMLEYAKVYINAVEKNNKIKLEIIPDSVSQLEFEELKIDLAKGYSGDIVLEYQSENTNPVTRSYNVKDETSSIYLTDVLKGLYFSTGIDDELGTKEKVYTLDIMFKNTDKILIDSIVAKIKNDITGKPLGDDEIYLQIANDNDYYYDLISATPNDFISMYNEFNWNYRDGMLTLLKGDYT